MLDEAVDDSELMPPRPVKRQPIGAIGMKEIAAAVARKDINSVRDRANARARERRAEQRKELQAALDRAGIYPGAKVHAANDHTQAAVVVYMQGAHLTLNEVAGRHLRFQLHARYTKEWVEANER